MLRFMEKQSCSLMLSGLQATKHLAGCLAKHIDPPLVIALTGTLGTGKTQFSRYLASALGVPEMEVTSPTYVLLQRYQGRFPIYHFDFYRLENESQVWDLGIDEIFEQSCLVLIEWADKFASCLPPDCLHLRLCASTAQDRTAELMGSGPHSSAILQATLANF